MYKPPNSFINTFRDIFYVKALGRFPRLQKTFQSIYRRWGRPILERFDLIASKDYPAWLEKTGLTPADIKSIKNQILGFRDKPIISIIMPVFNVAPKWLDAAIESVKGQIYPQWELCLVDDGSTRSDTLQYLDSISHPQIKKRIIEKNTGISAASNVAIQISTGEYIALMDHDDMITEDALFEIVKIINASDPDLIYSDEDRIDEDGIRKKPFFKPDWSPDLLRTQNYICHFTVIKKTIIEKIGGFRKGFEGAQDHDLFLRIAGISNKIKHIPRILYSWREIESSTTINPESKPLAQSAGLKAVDSHLNRHFQNGAHAEESDYLFVYDARYPLSGNPLISIIIPTKDNLSYLTNCLNSILAQSTYENYEIIILNNNSEEAETIEFFNNAENKYPNVKIAEALYPFNWSRLNNHGMKIAKGDVFIFLNNDTQVISKDWMERLGEQALRDDIAAVGPLLLYEDGTIQHAGVVVGMGGWADHVFKGMNPQHLMSSFVSPMVRRNVLAVTGSCLAISRKTIERIGPFNEHFIVCGSDVELCLRAYENGLKNIFDPFVTLYHFESKTRIPENIPDCDFDMSRKHYQRYFDNGDPYYNINLSLSSTTPALKHKI